MNIQPLGLYPPPHHSLKRKAEDHKQSQPIKRTKSTPLIAPEDIFKALKAKQYQKTLTLGAKALTQKETENIQLSASDVEKKITQWRSKNEASDTHIVKLVAHLCDAKVEDFHQKKDVVKYATHLYSLDKKLYRFKAECWENEAFYLQRIRSFVSLVAKKHVFKPEELGNLTQQQAEQRVYAEISIALEGLRLARRFSVLSEVNQAPHLKDTMVDYTTSLLVKKIKSLSLYDFEYLVPFGWSAHAFYIGFKTQMVMGKEVVSMYIDNLGDDAEYQKPKKGRNQSCLFNIPKEFLNEKAFTAFVRQLVLFMGEVKPLYTQGQLIETVKEFKTALLQKEKPHFVKFGQRQLHKHKVQSAGNCVLKNYHPGMCRRLTRSLFKAVKRFERNQAEIYLEEIFLSLKPYLNLIRAQKGNAKSSSNPAVS